MTDGAFLDWVVDIIGRPYKVGGRGPSSFDCWGVVRYFYWRQFKISLPLYQNENPFNTKRVGELMTEAEHSSDWEEVAEVRHGDVVAMSRSRVFHHVGVWLDIDGGLCLHALDGQSVVAQNMQRIKSEQFKRISFFRYDKGL